MTGVVGLGQRAMAGRQGPEVAAKAAAFDRLGMQVTPANVLAIYAVIMEEVSRLQVSIRAFQTAYFEGMPQLGDDLVSPYAARGFTQATNQLVSKCQTAIDDLKRVSRGLAEAARSYGKTEDQVNAVLSTSEFQNEPARPGGRR